MKVLIVGNGAREHALAWKVSQSPRVEKVFASPGNPGMASSATCIDYSVDDIPGLLDFAKQEQIDLTIVGPEYPCSLGIVDQFIEAGLAIFGPHQKAAQLETSKGFAKEIMTAAGVETAKYREASSFAEAQQIVAEFSRPVVLKADGLAAGKGVVICREESEVQEGLEYLFQKLDSDSIVIEEFIKGVEASFIVATDGTTVIPLATSHDYKRIGDGNMGPNTGGMGSLSPTPYLVQGAEQELVDTIIKPVLREMQKRGIPFQGFLYAGLILPQDGKPSVIEFNVRLGDPEAQSILRRWQSDILTDIEALLAGNATENQITWLTESAACIVKASQGYPASSRKGDVISGISAAEEMPDVVVFHAGTALDEKDQLVTNGGRVLSVTAVGGNAEEALQKAYKGADLISFPGEQSRRDIGGPNG
jgi:phosphoribosylamine---glycine ligase